MNRRGQVTIFIVLGLIIVASILFVFFYSGKIVFTTSPADNPDAYLKKCIGDSIKESEDSILSSNGFTSKDTHASVLYKSEQIPYLCMSYEYYSSCMPQEPMFIEKQRVLMENKVAIYLENCLTELKKDFEKDGYDVDENRSSVKMSFVEDSIIAYINMDFTAIRDESVIKLSDMEIIHPSKLFNILKLTQTIVNYESTLCEFGVMSWMSNDPEILIKRDSLSDQTRVYTLTERISQKEIKFAIRTCVLPAGL
jgi:hypothetical protein